MQYHIMSAMNTMYLMVPFIVLAFATAMDQLDSDQNRVSCKNLRPMQDIDLEKVLGSWLKLETAIYSYGVPWNPPMSNLHRSKLSCHRLDVLTVSRRKLKGVQNFYHSGSLSANADLSGKFRLRATQSGRWNIADPVQASGVKLLVLSLDPTSRLVVVAVCMNVAQLDEAACCSPLADVLNPQQRPKNESGELLTSISLLSPVSRLPQPDELSVAHDQMQSLLGGKELYFPLKLGHFCADL